MVHWIICQHPIVPPPPGTPAPTGVRRRQLLGLPPQLLPLLLLRPGQRLLEDHPAPSWRNKQKLGRQAQIDRATCI